MSTRSFSTFIHKLEQVNTKILTKELLNKIVYLQLLQFLRLNSKVYYYVIWIARIIIQILKPFLSFSYEQIFFRFKLFV